jgi:hypothetical protein
MGLLGPGTPIGQFWETLFGKNIIWGNIVWKNIVSAIFGKCHFGKCHFGETLFGEPAWNHVHTYVTLLYFLKIRVCNRARMFCP